MDYLQITGSLLQGNQIILEPEDWTEDQWVAFLDIFDLEEASRIVLSDYKVDAYGTSKSFLGGTKK